MDLTKEQIENIKNQIAVFNNEIQIQGLCDWIDDLEEENKRLLESCEGATMMYKDLCESKEIIKKLLALYFSPLVTQDDLKKQDEIIKQAEDFIKG